MEGKTCIELWHLYKLVQTYPRHPNAETEVGYDWTLQKYPKKPPQEVFGCLGYVFFNDSC